MAVSRRVLIGGVTLATALLPGKPRAAGGMERLQVHGSPRTAPAFTLTDAEGAPVAPESFAGQGVVLNFWATWCPPCVAEMPALDRLHAALAEARIIVVAASQDRGGANVVRPFYERTGVQHLPVWLDPRGAAGRAFGIRGLPTTVVLNRSGREVARLEGEATWDAPAMLDRLRALLPAAVPAAPETTAT
jgi:thiol-disulfide isomerase/thioredoxin